ncbi:isoamylase early set domain-containing protein [Aliifodinibius sp. S!AR15-10]|uniref:isoamylase early set domain-containing protein n=1 Tax=Aliifodinibius sp. S!AR15-10 TaxID=2950437 RepID=UPI00285670BF|nr:isoamylase early set domain-containing protein [Aliifodinibius sp. S!AR15-10]MDR8392036.1 isoamylase early set domain-containing protein [Aliifodinibius sp. S!AR15-10]
MFEMNYTPKRTVCKVTFRIPDEWAQDEAAIAGDFNDWDPEEHKMEKKDDVWETTVRLKPETEYVFKYLLDGERWENDQEAHDYVSNEFGTKDSVVVTGK